MAADPSLALAVLVAYCGWDPTEAFAGSTTLDGKGGQTLWLPSLAVSDVSAVAVTTDDGTVHDLAVAIDGDVWWSRKGELRLTRNALTSTGFGAWPCGLANVDVTWASSAVTDVNLSAVLDSLTSRLPRLGLNKAQIGTAVLQYGSSWAAGQLLDVEKMVLDTYRIVRVA